MGGEPSEDGEVLGVSTSNFQPTSGYTLVYAMVGMDVGFENPLFASIELSYEEVRCEFGWEVGGRFFFKHFLENDKM